MDVEMPKGRGFQKGFVELQIYEDDLDRLEQVRRPKVLNIDPLSGSMYCCHVYRKQNQ